MGSRSARYLDEALGYWQEGSRHPSAAWWLGHGLLLLGDLGTRCRCEEGIEGPVDKAPMAPQR
jgi:hypothetical protein